MQGDVTNPGGNPGGGAAVTGSPVIGATTNAPLGTNPLYDTQEITELIQTTKVSGTSSLRTASAEDRVLWVAVSLRGEEPEPGLPSPPITEGDEIDLHIRYQVFEGELSVSRQWILEEAGLNFIEPSVAHAEAGTYHAVFPFTLAYETGIERAVFKGVIGPVRTSSIVVIPDMQDYREVSFEIVETETLDAIYYPASDPDPENDGEGHGKGCTPLWITVESIDAANVHVESEKDLSNVVLQFEDGARQKWDGLSGESGDFMGTGANNGKTIVAVWVKSGCNQSGDGPGYGEKFDSPFPPAGTEENEMAMAQFAWDDDATAPDHDYNDFVGRMNIAEIRNLDNEMVQMLLTAKALARGSDNIADWQFNVGASFPGASEVFVIVNQYYADGTPHGNQRIYVSAAGATIPVFSPTADAFPSSGDMPTVNTEAGTTFKDGDYAEVLVILNDPQPQGTYTPIPYEPELLVSYDGETVVPIPLWSNPEDFDDGDPATYYPPAFIVPDTFAWVLESETVEQVYPEIVDWVDFMNDQDLPEPTPPYWQFTPVDGTQYFERELFN